MTAWKTLRCLFLVATGILLLSCGKGAENGPGAPGSPPPTFPTPEEAARFLTQTTFGPTLTDIEEVTRAGYESWLDEQFSMVPTKHLPPLLAGGDPEDQDRRVEIWWENSLLGEDQLRQRMAFALSQILVVSELGGGLANYADALAYYYDILLDHAFGNFRDLLEAVTLCPAMGVYLSMLGNQKPDPDAGIRADENFAREIMQLFTIGLTELNLDGTVKRDAQGVPVPTYDQDDIKNLARVFTGWTTAGTLNWYAPAQNPVEPMIPFEEFHDTDPKTILGDLRMPAGQSAREDLEMALDALFLHPNVGPFVGRQLIQRFVTSNPSPAYVSRVAEAFNDNGLGVRGDLSSVLRAVLLDEEARLGHLQDPVSFGKLREPLLRVTHLWRAFNASAANGTYSFHNPEALLAQAPLRAPSVFNFYRPDFSPPGEIADTGLVAPEFQITTESSVTTLTNVAFVGIHQSFRGLTPDGPEHILIDVHREAQMSVDPEQLLDHLNLLLFSGQMSSALHQTLSAHLLQVPLDAYGLSPGTLRALDAIYLIITSAEYVVQR